MKINPLLRKALIFNRAFTNSADGVASANTNLALKGILGIRAMAELAAIKGEITASQDYFVGPVFIEMRLVLILPLIRTDLGSCITLGETPHSRATTCSSTMATTSLGD